MILPLQNNIPDEIYIKILNEWFCKEEPQYTISDSMRNFAYFLIRDIYYGLEITLLQDRAEGVVKVLKDYCIIDYNKSISDLIFEGKKRAVNRVQDAFTSPEVTKEFDNLVSEVKKVVNKIGKQRTNLITKEVAEKEINLN